MRHMRDHDRPQHCTLSKDPYTEIGGADVAMQPNSRYIATARSKSRENERGAHITDLDGCGQGEDELSHLRRAAHQSAGSLVPARLLRLDDVKGRTGLSRSTIYQLIKVGKFPPNLNIGARAVAWLESDIERWIVGRVLAATKHSEAQ
jgi:prophage regulatory protein